MWWIKSYLWRHRFGIFLFFVFAAIFSFVFYLYHLPVEAVGYSMGLCIAIGILVMAVDSNRYRKKIKQLTFQKEAVKNKTQTLPEAEDRVEAAYQELLCEVQEERESQMAGMLKEKTDITDYFTLWAHQIKTPIAAMHLLLQQEHADAQQMYECRKESESELFKIEQYVDMVLQYLRLNSSVNDFVFKEYSLDDIIRQAVRKYAPMFIRKKLSLNYEPLSCTVVTDEKWMVFVLEQILSNAVKYTVSGTISIYMEEGILVVEDTGIGILEEDLPRIFAKGYTGYNGRSDKKATGIGLYLVKQVLNKLGHKIYIESGQKTGVRVKLFF